MDNKLTKQIQDWLGAMPDKQDVAAGAMLLLQINRNRILYNNILRNPQKLKSKLEYELRKHLKYRLDGLTLQQVVAMDKKVTKEVAKTVKENALKGRRADHDQLPPEIQQLFFEGHDLMVTMRSIHEKLKLMNSDKPCERYTFLKELLAVHDKYRDCYNRYDAYDVNNPTAETESEEVEADTVKAIATYRGYITTNIQKLQKLVEDGKTSAAERLRDKMQARFDECKKLNVQFSEGTLIQLKSLGIE